MFINAIAASKTGQSSKLFLVFLEIPEVMNLYKTKWSPWNTHAMHTLHNYVKEIMVLFAKFFVPFQNDAFQQPQRIYGIVIKTPNNFLLYCKKPGGLIGGCK